MTLNLTGDARRQFADGSNIGFIKMADPFPFNFKWDPNDEAAGWQRSLDCLHDQILLEGPESIAAIFLESIAGANMWLKPSTEWMQGVRALCDKYGILLVMDEVMTGFGRTGKMFGFEHYEGVLPDIVTFAKGITSSYMPLSGVGCRDHIMDFFRKNPLGYGATYVAHPVACAAAYETVKHIMEIDLVSHVKNMEGVMIEELDKMIDKHPCVRQARMYGLAGGFDLADKNGDFLMWPHEINEGVNMLKRKFKEEGVVTIVRGHFVHCTPPLVITPEEIRDGFDRLDRCLTHMDEYILTK
jgi:adenosylmethionine-8-amino-7-oxononanoate aminotransferase